jgi:glycosyltransferase involved in cell wall biosynthesis
LNILLYSRRFFPDIGGIESVSLTLAEQIVAAGHSCTVVTETSAPETLPGWSFSVERAPNRRRRMRLVQWADVVHSNGASLAFFPYAALLRKPFIWTHQGYQLVSVDGLGWADGKPAPLTPLASLRFHYPSLGLRASVKETLKLALRRAVGFSAAKNVAITRWVAQRQPLPRQVVIYNPFSLSRFRVVASMRGSARYDFLFVGRLVTEKGVDTLLRALAALNARTGRSPASLLIIGDGPHRTALEGTVKLLGLGPHVRFAGKMVGRELVDAIPDGKIAIVPSEWEEAMGGVALELMAAGRPIIVSERGGLAECISDGGWTFPNGDHAALADLMATLLDDESVRYSKTAEALRVLKHFDETALAHQYLNVYSEVCGLPIDVQSVRRAGG